MTTSSSDLFFYSEQQQSSFSQQQQQQQLYLYEVSYSYSSNSFNESSLYYDHEISSLTDTQERIISILPIPSALVSVLSSATIICMAYYSRQRSSSSTTYTRLLIAMSCNDILFSTAFALNAFLLPADSSQRIWAFGSDATCSIMGFCLQLSLSGILYNGMLGFYFVLTAKYGVSKQTMSTYIEPLMHLISLGYPLITATIGSILGVYHETELGQSCWVANYPENCGEAPGETGEPCQSTLLGYVFGAIMVAFTLLSLLLNNLAILLFVRKQVLPITTKTKTNARRQEERPATTISPSKSTSSNNNKKQTKTIAAATTTTTTTTTTMTSTNTTGTTRNHPQAEKLQQSSWIPYPWRRGGPREVVNNNTITATTVVHEDEYTMRHSSNLCCSSSNHTTTRSDHGSDSTGTNANNADDNDNNDNQIMGDAYDYELDYLDQEEEGNNDEFHRDGEDADHDLDFSTASDDDFVEEGRGKCFLGNSNNLMQQQEYNDRLRKQQLERLQLVASQSYLYVTAFLLSTTWAVLLRILESLNYNKQDEDSLFPLLVCQAIFVPIQGLFNLCIYARPKYLKYRKEFPTASRFYAFQRAIYGDRIALPNPKSPDNKKEEGKRKEHTNCQGNNDNTENANGVCILDQNPDTTNTRGQGNELTADEGTMEPARKEEHCRQHLSLPALGSPFTASSGHAFSNGGITSSGGNRMDQKNQDTKHGNQNAEDQHQSTTNKKAEYDHRQEDRLSAFTRPLPRSLISSLTTSQGDFSLFEDDYYTTNDEYSKKKATPDVDSSDRFMVPPNRDKKDSIDEKNNRFHHHHHDHRYNPDHRIVGANHQQHHLVTVVENDNDDSAVTSSENNVSCIAGDKIVPLSNQVKTTRWSAASTRRLGGLAMSSITASLGDFSASEDEASSNDEDGENDDGEGMGTVLLDEAEERNVVLLGLQHDNKGILQTEEHDNIADLAAQRQQRKKNPNSRMPPPKLQPQQRWAATASISTPPIPPGSATRSPLPSSSPSPRSSLAKRQAGVLHIDKNPVRHTTMGSSPTSILHKATTTSSIMAPTLTTDSDDHHEDNDDGTHKIVTDLSQFLLLQKEQQTAFLGESSSSRSLPIFSASPLVNAYGDTSSIARSFRSTTTKRVRFHQDVNLSKTHYRRCPSPRRRRLGSGPTTNLSTSERQEDGHNNSTSWEVASSSSTTSSASELDLSFDRMKDISAKSSNPPSMNIPLRMPTRRLSLSAAK